MKTLKEYLEEATGEDGVINYEKANTDFQNDFKMEIGAVSAKKEAKFKEELDTLAYEKRDLEEKLKNIDTDDTYMKKKLSTLSDENLSIKRELTETRKREEARELRVDKAIVDNLIANASDLDKIDFTPFHGTAKASANFSLDDNDDNALGAGEEKIFEKNHNEALEELLSQD